MVISGIAFSRWSGSNTPPPPPPPNAFPRKLGSLGDSTNLLLSFLILGSLIPISIKLFDYPQARIILGYSSRPNTPAWLTYPHNIYM